MRDWINNQYQNLFLYVPFLMAGGGALYFTSEYEPSFTGTFLFMLLCGGLIFIKRVPIILRAVCIFVFSFCYACVFTNLIDTPKLTRDLHNYNVVGTVKSIDYTNDKSRIYLSVNAADINAGNGNATIRVSVSDGVALPNISDVVRANIGLFKPAPAYAPETFDYARWAYFNKLTATGYTDKIEILDSKNSYRIGRLRNMLHNRSNSFLADTLVLGYKGAIPKSDTTIWTATGIGHVWSISGFHMTLVGGWLFLIFYFIFRATPYVTRRTPAKIPAMCCAWIGLMAYLFLSGADVATTRAFLMATLAFVAFAFGRSAISMRNIAIAFCIILLINPHYVMQAGFQLSFAAVFGLVWFFTVVKPKMPTNKILRIVYISVLTTIVATIFTAPFVAMHFGAIPIYGLIGNLFLLPIFSFAIMPLIFIGVIFGIAIPITVAHNIYDFLFGVATHIADFPFASITMPHIPNTAIVCFTVGFMCLMLIRNLKWSVNYILCALFMIAGITCVCLAPRPIFMATYDNELVAFVRDDGKLEFNKSRASNHYFAFNTWKQLNGKEQDTPNRRHKHENGLYRYGNIVYVQKFVPLMKNIDNLCRDDSVKYIVSYYEISSNMCAHKLLRGGFVIYPNGRVKYTIRNRRWN